MQSSKKTSAELLGIYLNDHLAGAVAGSELARKLSADNEGTPLGTYLSTLAHAIDADRLTLEELMDRLDVDKSVLKQATGWVAEKLSRFKLSDQMTESTDLKRLLEFEMLGTGIHGKLAGWHALRQIRTSVPALAETDFDRLIARAEEQRDGLEQHRLAAATGAFTD
jgi:hypothetical protein